MSHVIVLHGPSPGHASAEWECSLLHRVPYARRLELETRHPDARRASLGGTALLLHAAGRLGYDALGAGDLHYPEGAKPRIRGGPYFSISHTARRVACAASREFELGLDHEEYGGDEAPAGLRHWTAVEATLKAAGAGLRRAASVEVDPECRRSLLDGIEYHLVPVDLGRGVVACLAAVSPPNTIDVQRLEDVAA
jgi:phosphopantetheinyl transferase